MASTKVKAGRAVESHPAVERLTQAVLSLLETKRVSADEAARLIKYSAQGTFFNEKLKIVTRLQEGSIGVDEATQLIEALVGNPNHMDAEQIERINRNRREFIAKITALLIVLSIVTSALLMPTYFGRVSKMFMSDLQGHDRGVSVIVGVLACLILFCTPPVVLLWIRAALDCLLTPHHLFPGTFTVRGTYEKIVWLVILLVTGALGVFSFFMIFQADRLYLRFIWFSVTIASVAMGQFSYFLVTKPGRR